MRDDDFEKVLSRFDRRSKKGGGQISEDTANRYRSKARDFREWLNKPMEEADFVDVEDWYAELDDRYQSDSAVNKGKGGLAAFFEIANKLADADRINIDGWGRESPADRAHYSPETTDTLKQRDSREDLHYLKPEQVDEMARATERLRDELIIRLLFQTGIRVSELCNIRWSKDVDTDVRSINIRGKGRKNRPVYYQPSLDLLVNVWVEERRPAVYYAEESEYLFPTSHSERISRDAVDTVVREAADAVNLQEVYGTNIEGVELHSVTPHVLRHSFAMAALSNGWDVYTLSQALGHESTEITSSTYLHDDEDNVRDAYRGRGPVTSDA